MIQVSNLSWLAGLWGGEVGGAWHEEFWLPPRGGTMLGVHREVGETGEVLFEFLCIGADDGDLIFSSKSNLQVRGKSFRLRESGQERVLFANSTYGFPQVVEYWRETDILRARIRGVSASGAERSMDWSWPRIVPDWDSLENTPEGF